MEGRNLTCDFITQFDLKNMSVDSFIKDIAEIFQHSLSGRGQTTQEEQCWSGKLFAWNFSFKCWTFYEVSHFLYNLLENI